MIEPAPVHSAMLPDRGVIAVTGRDAAKLLDGVITNDMNLLTGTATGTLALHAALLTPQGKIIADFFVATAADGFVLDCPRSRVTELVKRLTMYRLRAEVAITDLSSTHIVVAVWDRDATLTDIQALDPQAAGSIRFTDPRHAGLGQRIIAPLGAHNDATADAVDYHEHRIGLGIPEGGRDYAFGDTFAHEALLDQLHGVSFTKGCYVGQEIVSRMQHRGTARKRIVRVVAPGALPAPGAEIAAGETVIGTLGSVSGHEGLALIRLDRAAEALAKGIMLAAGPSPITIEVQPWATFTLG